MPMLLRKDLLVMMLAEKVEFVESKLCLME